MRNRHVSHILRNLDQKKYKNQSVNVGRLLVSLTQEKIMI